MPFPTPEVPTLHLVLAEAAVELVPQPLWSHPSVSRSAKKRTKKTGEILLEDTYHHAAMREATKKGRFEDRERRGRPDIVHTTLLVVMESILNKEGRLQVWVHTQDDRVIWIRPDTRLQRAQHRFFGLLEDLLVSGRVPSVEKGDALMSVKDGMSLSALLEEIAPHHVLLFDEHGDTHPIEAIATEGAGVDDRVAAVIGAYPTGPLRSDLSGLTVPVQSVSLGPEPLTAWTAAAELLVRYRRAARD